MWLLDIGQLLQQLLLLLLPAAPHRCFHEAGSSVPVGRCCWSGQWCSRQQQQSSAQVQC